MLKLEEVRRLLIAVDRPSIARTNPEGHEYMVAGNGRPLGDVKRELAAAAREVLPALLAFVDEIKETHKTFDPGCWICRALAKLEV